jgi:kynurenine formamidase
VRLGVFYGQTLDARFGETDRAMSRQFIDLSDTLSNRTGAHEPNAHEITYVSPVEAGRDDFGVPGLWPDGRGWAVETVTLSTHAGTHVDAPYHYGGGGRTIDEVPLDWCYGRGVRLDLRSVDRAAGIRAADVERELAAVGHALEPLDVVLIWTGTSARFGEPGYFLLHAGLRRDATELLVDAGVRLIGIDAWGIDRAFDVMLEDHRAGRAQFWESHLLGREKEYCQIERLANLDALPGPTGFTVAAFPFKLEAASAGWARVVAIVDEPTSG